LAVKRDGLLAQALRVADIAVHHLLEGKLRRVGFQSRLDLTRLGHDGASDRVLHVLDLLIDIVNGDRH
jgi:hypothetical protein